MHIKLPRGLAWPKEPQIMSPVSIVRGGEPRKRRAPEGRRSAAAKRRTGQRTLGKELHVVFGAGQVGTPLAGRLLEAGKRVRVVKRTAVEVPPGAEVLLGDAVDARSVTRRSVGQRRLPLHESQCRRRTRRAGLRGGECARERLDASLSARGHDAGSDYALCTNLGTSHRCRSSSAVDRETSGLVVLLMREISEMLYRWDELFVVGISALDNDSG